MLWDQFFLIQQILFTPTILTTDCQDMDVVLQESRVSDQLRRTCLGNLILTPAEIQMDTFKPDATDNMQLFKTLTMKGLMFQNSSLIFHNESLNTDKHPSANNNNSPGSANESERLGSGGHRPYVRN